MRQGAQSSPPEPFEDSRCTDAGLTDSSHPRRRLLPFSIRTSLVIVLLVPLFIVVGLVSTLVVRQLSTRRQAVSARQSSRGAALEALQLDMARVHRSEGALMLALLFIDLDDLKSINDSIGHDGGDGAIRAVADSLRLTTRASDVIARFGGDEFVVGWLGDRDSEAPMQLATRISASVAKSEIGADGHLVALACSIGVAVSEPSDTTVETLIERADRALYCAKASGRGQIRLFGQRGPAVPALAVTTEEVGLW